MEQRHVCFPYEFTLLSNNTTVTTDCMCVCFPYEFTLLSNRLSVYSVYNSVCFPYEFTLLSNHPQCFVQLTIVCFPYEFTLLSNNNKFNCICFLFVSPTNLHCSQTSNLKLPEKNICEIFV